jgi:hypothetical protein
MVAFKVYPQIRGADVLVDIKILAEEAASFSIGRQLGKSGPDN